MNKLEDHFGRWKNREEIAEAMIPMIGKLYREKNVTVTVYSRALVNKSVIQILKTHRFVKQIENTELSVVETFPILQEVVKLDLGASRIDIGKIAVCGTVNDLAVGGAKPLWLSAAFIIEEGCEIALLHRIVASMQAAAEEAGVRIVTGDTKVVGKGQADKVFVTTAGVGVIPPGRDLRADAIQPGDVAIVNGVLGDHGAAIMAARGDMALSTDLESDCQSLNGLIEAVIAAAPDVRAARDATRGGLASALNELAGASAVSVEIDETALPLRPEVKGVCEILGLDPLYLANEGTLVLFVPADQAGPALKAMRSTPAGREAVVIGKAAAGPAGRVTMRTLFGGQRLVDMLVGEQLPRIC